MPRHWVIVRKLILIGAVTMTDLFAAQLGYVQTWLAPAYPALAMRGPGSASGALVWSHGISNDSEDSEAPTPPFMARLVAPD